MSTQQNPTHSCNECGCEVLDWKIRDGWIHIDTDSPGERPGKPVGATQVFKIDDEFGVNHPTARFDLPLDFCSPDCLLKFFVQDKVKIASLSYIPLQSMVFCKTTKVAAAIGNKVLTVGLEGLKGLEKGYTLGYGPEWNKRASAALQKWIDKILSPAKKRKK